MNGPLMPPASEQKSLALGYALWALGLVGLCGVHRLYLGQAAPGLLYLFTFGLCGIGQLLDLILLPSATKVANAKLILPENSSRTDSTSIPGQASYADAIGAYRQGQNAQSKGNHHDALMHYQKSLELEADPRSKSFVHFNMGSSHECLGDQYSALSSYKQAILLNPKLAHAYNNMAAIHRALGADAAASGNRHLAHQHAGRAQHFWRRAVSLSPHGFPEATKWLAAHQNDVVKSDETIDVQAPSAHAHSSSSTELSDYELDDLIDHARQSMKRINLSNELERDGI